jgi:putative adhesin Stv-like protein
MSDTPAGATPVGKYFYLFKSPISTPECLISAHGGHDRERHFQVPAGVTVNFYALHGFTLQDPGTALLNAQVNPKESIAGPTSCHDYSLSKYQGRHNKAGETYASIDAQVQSTAQARTAAQSKYMKAAAQGAPDWKLGIARQNVTSQNAINIVTVRNRVGAGDIRLSDLITAVRGAFPSITIFHCSFCRSSMNFDAGLSQKANMGAEHIV